MYSVDWIAKHVTIPLSDLTLISGVNYSLSTVDVHKELRRLEWDFNGGLWADYILKHYPTVTLSGIPKTSSIEMVNQYTWGIDASNIIVSITGIDSNLFDKFIPVNGVSILGNNSVGKFTVVSGSGLTTEQSNKLDDLHGQADRSVYLDPLIAITGDGSQGLPFKTPNEAVDYVEANGVRGIKLFNNIILAKAMRNVLVEGINLPEFDPDGFDLKGTKLLNVKLTGSVAATEQFIIQQSVIENDAGLNGFVEKCTFTGNCSLTGHTHIVNSFSNKPGSDYINLDTNGYILQVTNWHRSLGISNMTSGIHTIEMYGGQLHLDVGCTGGTIHLRGNYSKAPNNLGSTVIIDETESFVSNSIRAAEMNRRKSVGLVDTIYDDDGITPLQEFNITKNDDGEVIEIAPR